MPLLDFLITDKTFSSTHGAFVFLSLLCVVLIPSRRLPRLPQKRSVCKTSISSPYTHTTPSVQSGGKTRSALQDVVTREYTIHLHKLVHGRSFKKRAPWAVKSVVDFAHKAMGTSDVRIDPKLNQALWARGIKSVPHRLRVKLERELVPISREDEVVDLFLLRALGKRNDEENAKEKLYTYASHVPVPSFKVRLQFLAHLYQILKLYIGSANRGR